MNKTFYYYFGYSTIPLNWQDVFGRASNVVVYNDQIIDSVLGTTSTPTNNTRIGRDDSNSQQLVQSTDSSTITASSNVQVRRYYIITNEKITHIDLTYTNDFISTQDIENIIIANKTVYIKGFLFIRRRKYLIDQMVNSACDNDFNETSTKLGLDTWKLSLIHI